MCKLFEGFAGAVAIHFEVTYALDWLIKLFDPWVVRYCIGNDAATKAVSIWGIALHKYELCMHGFGGVTLAPPVRGIGVNALAGFGPTPADRPSRPWRMALSSRVNWKEVDAYQAQFDETYPPRPPPVTDAQLLTDALTRDLYRIHLREGVFGNNGYQLVGDTKQRDERAVTVVRNAQR